MQTVERAGFTKSCLIKGSATKPLTQDLEKARMDELGAHISGTLGRNAYKKWSWGVSNKSSALFLHSPPDEYELMEDPVFMHVITVYLGQPCPLVSPLAGRYFGRHGTIINEYGANISSAPLPGQRWRTIHNRIEALTQNMMKLGGIFADRQALNLITTLVRPTQNSALTTLRHSKPPTKLNGQSCRICMLSTSL